jgi:predicted acetyltransferase
MMRYQLEQVVERGEPMAILTASEASIYGRFGYGVATHLRKVRIDTSGGLALRVPCRAEGTFRLLDADEVVPTLAPLQDAMRRATTGDILRPPRWWDVHLRDRSEWRDGASHRFDVVHTTGGVVDGALSYRIKHVDRTQAPGWEVKLGQLLATDPEVEVALLQYASEIDLTASMTTWARPIDDWLPYRLVDSRRYRTELVFDHIYARVLDVERVLSARTYDGEGTLVLDVVDDFRPASGGTFRLAGGACERADGATPDLTLDASALGSLVLGDARPSVLAAAGRIAPASSDALRVADRLFPTAPAPFTALDV